MKRICFFFLLGLANFYSFAQKLKLSYHYLNV